MEVIGKLLFGGGFLVAIVTQLLIVFHAFRIRFSAGLFCLIITPIYALISSDMKNDKKIARIIPIWLTAFALMIIGVIMLGVII
jgi:hypothetical protein